MASRAGAGPAESRCPSGHRTNASSMVMALPASGDAISPGRRVVRSACAVAVRSRLSSLNEHIQASERKAGSGTSAQATRPHTAATARPIDQHRTTGDHHPATLVVPRPWQPGGPITLASDKQEAENERAICLLGFVAICAMALGNSRVEASTTRNWSGARISSLHGHGNERERDEDPQLENAVTVQLRPVSTLASSASRRQID